jgi:excisionase family DNA binding protein
VNEPVRQRAFSTKEVAVILGVPYEQVRRLIVNSELAHLTIGRHFRVTEMELERFMKSAVRGTPE